MSKNNIYKSKSKDSRSRIRKLLKAEGKAGPKYMITSKINQDLVPIAAPTDIMR